MRLDPPNDPEDDSEPEVVDYERIGYLAEQFVVTPNPEIGRIWLPNGEFYSFYERDNRFGFGRWVEDRD